MSGSRAMYLPTYLGSRRPTSMDGYLEVDQRYYRNIARGSRHRWRTKACFPEVFMLQKWNATVYYVLCEDIDVQRVNK